MNVKLVVYISMVMRRFW